MVGTRRPGEQPAPHSTLAEAAARIDLVERYAAMAAGIGWTRGVLDQAGLIDDLIALPEQLCLQLPSAELPSWACTRRRVRTTARGSNLASPTRSCGRCSTDAAPTWSSAAILIWPLIVWLTASVPSIPAARANHGPAAQPAGFSSRTKVMR